MARIATKRLRRGPARPLAPCPLGSRPEGAPWREDNPAGSRARADSTFPCRLLLKFHICPEADGDDQVRGAEAAWKNTRRTVRPEQIQGGDIDLKGSGAWGRIRTTDTRIFNPLLYQLSYPGPGPKERSKPLWRPPYGGEPRL